MADYLSPEVVLVLPPEEAAQARAELPDPPWEAFAPASAPPAAPAPPRVLRLVRAQEEGSEALTPELVLVASPEAAAQARRALPDRPWEAFLPAPAPAAPAGRRAEPVVGPVASEPVRRRRVTVGGSLAAALLVGLAVFLVVPAALRPLDAPSFGGETLPTAAPPRVAPTQPSRVPPVTTTPTTVAPATTTAPATPPAPAKRTAPTQTATPPPAPAPPAAPAPSATPAAEPRPVARPEPAAKPRPEPAAKPKPEPAAKPKPELAAKPKRVAPARKPAPSRPPAPPPPPPPPPPSATTTSRSPRIVTPVRQPVGGRLYVFPGGRFRITPDGSTITGFETTIACAPAELPPIAVGDDGTYRLQATIGGVRVELFGGFADPNGASLTLRFRSARCDSGIVRLDAHLA